MKKYLLLLFLSIALFLGISVSNVFAQDSPSSQSASNNSNPIQTAPPAAAYPLNTDPDVPQNLHTYTQSSIIELLSAATCFIGGQDIVNPTQKCLGIDPLTKKLGYVDNSSPGLTGAMGGLIGATFNIPVSSSEYGHYLADSFGVTKTSYAQGLGTGYGFGALAPVLEIWKAFRNLTYLLFVFIFILLGLGIMFRLNIDARTVMTIQNQIPKIIIGLLLITFSYAIAGFLIDMMYVGIYLVINVFNSAHLTTVTNVATNPLNAIGSFGGINSIAAPAAQSVGGMISSLFNGSIGGMLSKIIMGIIGGFIGNSLGGLIPGVGGLIGGGVGFIAGIIVGGIFGNAIIGYIATAIAYLIISIAIFTALFRVWFMLIKAYIFILLDVIFGPFWIVGGILPGAPGGFGPWLRSLIANLAAFPTVLVLFMIGKTIQDQATNLGGNFVPPLVGNTGPEGNIASLIGLGIILIMPEAVNITKSTLKAPENKYTSAVGKSLGAGTASIQSLGKNAKHALWYTDPRTGEAGRLKAWTGHKVAEKLDNIPVVGHFSQKIRQSLPKSPSQANRENEAKIAEMQDEIRNFYVPPPPKATATPGAPTAPVTEAERATKAREIAVKRGFIQNPNEYDRRLSKLQKTAVERLALDYLKREKGID